MQIGRNTYIYYFHNFCFDYSDQWSESLMYACQQFVVFGHQRTVCKTIIDPLQLYPKIHILECEHHWYMLELVCSTNKINFYLLAFCKLQFQILSIYLKTITNTDEWPLLEIHVIIIGGLLIAALCDPGTNVPPPGSDWLCWFIKVPFAKPPLVHDCHNRT